MQWFIVMNASTAKKTNLPNITGLMCHRTGVVNGYRGVRQPQTNRNQHGVKRGEERRPGPELWQTEYTLNKNWWWGRKQEASSLYSAVQSQCEPPGPLLLCKISNRPRGLLIRDKERSSEGVSGITRTREGNGCSEIFQSRNLTVA